MSIGVISLIMQDLPSLVRAVSAVYWVFVQVVQGISIDCRRLPSDGQGTGMMFDEKREKRVGRGLMPPTSVGWPRYRYDV
jgi:hypothetical protein